MFRYIILFLMLIPSLTWGQIRSPSTTGGANDSLGVYIGSSWEYIYPAWLRGGSNITLTRDNDTLYIATSATAGTVDTLYIKFGDSFSASGWFQSGDTLFIDTLVTDSVSVAGWNFVNDSAGVAAFGFIAGAHTDSSNIKSWNFINDSTGIAAYGFVAGPHPDSVDKALKDAAGNVITSTYETIANVGKIGDDTTNFKTAYSWGDHSGLYPTAADFGKVTDDTINYQTAYTHSQTATGNPHSLDTDDVTEGSNKYLSLANLFLYLAKTYFDSTTAYSPDSLKVVFSDSAGVVLFSDLNGAATDGQIPNNITINFADSSDKITDQSIGKIKIDSTGTIVFGTIYRTTSEGSLPDSQYAIKGDFYGIKASPSPSDNYVLKIDTDTDPDSFYFALDNTTVGAGLIVEEDGSPEVTADSLNFTLGFTITNNGSAICTVKVDESALTLSNLRGSVTDGQIPDNITLDSTKIADEGFVAGAHTVLDDTLLGINEGKALIADSLDEYSLTSAIPEIKVNGATSADSALAPDSATMESWNFVNDSTEVAAFGYIAGAHTDSADVAGWNYFNLITDIFALMSRSYFDTLASGDSILVIYADSTDLSIFDTDDLTQGSSNLYNQTHSGDVTGATELTIANSAVDTIMANSTEWSKYVKNHEDNAFADSTGKIDTTYAGFTTYVSNHAGGSGEVNTASSQGSGTSIYYQKSSVDLQFNAIKSETDDITVSLDGSSHDIEFTFNPGSVAATELSDGSNVAHINANETITGNWVNTDYPWANNEIADLPTSKITSGTFLHERGGLEADINAYNGLIRINSGATSNITNLAGLNTALSSSIADGAHTVLDDTLLGVNEGDALYQPLESTLTDIADGTIAENLVNTTNPWADNEIATSGNWNTAYGWGDWSTTVGKITDDTTNFHTAYDSSQVLDGIRDDIRDTVLVMDDNWNTAYGWGDHSGLYLPKSDSGSYYEIGGLSIFNTKIYIGNAADTAVADSQVATLGFVRSEIEDSLNSYALLSNPSFTGTLTGDSAQFDGNVDMDSIDVNGAANFGSNVTVNGKTITGNHCWTFNIFDPYDVYSSDAEFCIDGQTEADLTITKIYVTLDADPTTELEFSLKYADAFIGFANATTIDDTATVAGVTEVTGGFGDATVPANKCIYIAFDEAPDADTKQMFVKITWDFD